jgi:hypothetical protein
VVSNAGSRVCVLSAIQSVFLRNNTRDKKVQIDPASETGRAPRLLGSIRLLGLIRQLGGHDFSGVFFNAAPFIVGEEPLFIGGHALKHFTHSIVNPVHVSLFWEATNVRVLLLSDEHGRCVAAILRSLTASTNEKILALQTYKDKPPLGDCFIFGLAYAQALLIPSLHHERSVRCISLV